MQGPNNIPRGVTAAFASAGLAEGTNANTFKIAAPNGAGVDFAIDGYGYHKADTDNIDFTAGHSDIADLYTGIFLVQINSAGTVSTKQGTSVLTADLEAGEVALQVPEADAGCCPLGAIRVKNAQGSAWTPGSEDLGAANITDTYYNFVGGAPSRPLGS